MIIVYIIQGLESARIYIGITKNLGRRLREHRKKQSTGSIAVGDFKLIHTEEFPDYKTARIREKFLKSGKGREWIKDNVSGFAKGE